VTALWKKIATEVSSPFLAALVLCGGFWTFVAWDQSHSVESEGGLQLRLAGARRLSYSLRDFMIGGQELSPQRLPVQPRAVRVWSGGMKWLMRVLIGCSLTAGAGMFLLGALYRAGAGTSHPGTLAITLGMIGAVVASPVVECAGGAVDGFSQRFRRCAGAFDGLVPFSGVGLAGIRTNGFGGGASS